MNTDKLLIAKKKRNGKIEVFGARKSANIFRSFRGLDYGAYILDLVVSPFESLGSKEEVLEQLKNATNSYEALSTFESEVGTTMLSEDFTQDLAAAITAIVDSEIMNELYEEYDNGDHGEFAWLFS